MPPLMMTNVMPMATMARNDDETARLAKFAVEANFEPKRTTPSSTTTTSTIAAADRWISDVTDPRDQCAATSLERAVVRYPGGRVAVIGAGPVGCRPRRR